jgi:hypothetical protein
VVFNLILKSGKKASLQKLFDHLHCIPSQQKAAVPRGRARTSPRPIGAALTEKSAFTSQSTAFEGKFINACKPAP